MKKLSSVGKKLNKKDLLSTNHDTKHGYCTQRFAYMCSAHTMNLIINNKCLLAYCTYTLLAPVRIMKRLIDITDEDVIAVIDRIHLLTENKVISRNGLHGLTFEDSFRKYGSASIDIECVSNDTVTDGYYTTVSKCRIQFHNESVWFTEFGCDDDISGYNKNHFFGYLKLQELGYKLPDTPQWT